MARIPVRGRCWAMAKDGAFHTVLIQGFGDVEMDAGTAHHPVPEKVAQAGKDQAGRHGFTDGSALGDPGDEYGHKGGPAHPPGPVEYGPGTDPVALITRAGEQAHGDEVKQVLAHGVGTGQVDKENGGPEDQDKEPYGNKYVHVDVADEFNPFFNPCVNGDGENSGEHTDDDISGAEPPSVNAVLVFQSGRQAAVLQNQWWWPDRPRWRIRQKYPALFPQVPWILSPIT